MRKKIRFLATGDFHSHLKLTKKIKESVDFSTIDFVLFTGDLSDKPNDFGKLLEPFKGKDIFMVPGNHDTKRGVDTLVDKYNIHLVGNSPIVIEDKLAIFGTNYIEIGPSGVFEEKIFSNMVENFKEVENYPFKIQMNHIPPCDTEIGDASPFPFITGSEPLSDFLEDFHPDVCFVGHIHETSGLEEKVFDTRVINLAETFKVFEFDFEKNTLTDVTKSVNLKSDKKKN